MVQNSPQSVEAALPGPSVVAPVPAHLVQGVPPTGLKGLP